MTCDTTKEGLDWCRLLMWILFPGYCYNYVHVTQASMTNVILIE